MGKLINPATGKPFVEVKPTAGIRKMREQIIHQLNRRRTQMAKYDAAQDSSQNEKHWQWADDLSPDAANKLSVRKRLRARSRYEMANNGYLKGIVLTKSMDTVGSGPTLQVTDKRLTTTQRNVIEQTYKRRSKKIKQRRKLRQLTMGKIRDGESFSVEIRNNRLRSKIKVDQKVVECDQFSHYTLGIPKPYSKYHEIDGIRFEKKSGEPAYYHLLKVHPGEDSMYSLGPLDGEWISQEKITHWFRRDRPWLRGVPETLPTLPLWALLRRYTLAVVQNAEIAADFTVLLKSLQTPSITPFSSSGGEPTESDADDWFDSFPVDRGMMTALPDGYELDQLKPAQPVTVYDQFVNALVQEASRPILVPRNMALGNSGGYNMASGALDRQLYVSAISDEREDCGDEVLDKDFDQWWYEAVRTPGYFVDEVGGRSVVDVASQFQDLKQNGPDHVWRWDDIPEHTDPVKVATSLDILHKAGHLSDIDIQERRFNRRVDDHYDNLRQQKEFRDEIGNLQGEPEMDPRDAMYDDDGT